MLYYRVLLCLALPLAVFGCKREAPSSTGASPSTSAENAATAQVPVASVQAAPPAPASPTAEPVNLDRELRKWILRNRRPPKNFEDFAATSGVEIPPPPAGKKYVVDKTMHVVLANR